MHYDTIIGARDLAAAGPAPDWVVVDCRFDLADPAWLRARGAEDVRVPLPGSRRYAPRAVVHMCGSGVTACHNLLAMELAGLTGSRLYAGSWSEWIADPARPVAVCPH
jgi:hypothetical protein